MSVLEKIRNNSALMVGLVGIGLASFILGDAFQNGNTWFSASQNVALSVDGESVDIEDYQRRLQAMTEQIEQRYGGQKLSDDQRMSINNNLAQQLIAETVLNKLAQQVGVQVTPDEIYALLVGGQGVMPSPMASQFFANLGINIEDASAVNDFIKQISDKSIQSMPQEQQPMLRAMQAQWRSLQESLLSSRLQQKLQGLLSRTYKVTKLDQELAVASGSRTVALVRHTPMVGTDKNDTPTEDEIKKYYDTHKNLFLNPEQSADISYISLQVVPSSEDYKAAEAEAQKAYAELHDASVEQVADVVRNYNGSFQNTYLTGEELEQLGLSAKEADFVKTAEVGAVQNSGLINDKYNLVRLVAKKQGIPAMGIKVIVLDSLMSTKTDSLLSALKGGASFDEMVERYSQDPQSKSQAGRIVQQGQYGMTQDTFSEVQLGGSVFAQVYDKPVGEAFVVDNGAAKLILKSVDAKPIAPKYQVAVVVVDANFSDKTYNAKYDILNRILGAGGKFEDMVAAAEKEGFVAIKHEAISTSTPQLATVPASRSLVSWALNADEGAITDKVYRIGSDYLVIAANNKHFDAGVLPLSQVKEQIQARLSAEKRANNLVEQLTKKNLATLEAYAEELNVAVDTLVGVNYFVRGSEGAAFNGKVMTTPIGQLSKPFAAGTEVMVVKPVSAEGKDVAVVSAQAKQAEQGQGYQLAGAVFQDLLKKTKIQDNRARFY